MSVREYIGSIDQGTTSTRFIIFDHSGDIVASQQIEHEQIYPHPGWSEQDPEEIWKNVQECITNTLKTSGISSYQLKAVGITNQRETTIVWDKTTGKPVCNAIVWHDGRTHEIVQQFKDTPSTAFPKLGQDRLREVTGLPLSTYFSSSKLKWILDTIPGARAKAEEGLLLFGTVDTWLLWHLSGGTQGGLHLTDVTNASRTNLMNLDTLNWDDSILDFMNLPKRILPEIRSSSEIYFSAHPNTCLPNIPIAGVLGDQHAALFGQTCFGAGEAKNTYGTGCFFMMNTGSTKSPSTKGLLTTIAYKIGAQPPMYALEGSIAYTGALVQWIRDNLKMISNVAQIEELARNVPDNGGVYLVPAFSGLFAPYWREDARGVLVGLTAFATRDHIARAALEATAYQTKEVVEAMESDADMKLTALKVDGGMVVNELLMQFQSDLLNVQVLKPQILETTALGAAYAAGLAVNFWKNEDELRVNFNVSATWEPNFSEEKRSELMRMWKKAVERTLNWET
uniref:glycerol kinase n=1 Tax=Albugo laibachii Nc14 TaxID=890382 RepID=F0WRN6_9STRA|nr:glycerol kinase 1 putative [Albugo laibachii Nc14]|eukprot:CCA24000.1 glycerol kinase 1 putative [Albugo laibachii Nc14]